MPASQLLDNLAAAIHDLWRERLSEEGWKVAREFSDQARAHDAMVPFAELKPADRSEAIQIARSWVDKLVAELEYPHGDDRPLTLEEMTAGMPVGWAKRLRVKYADSTQHEGVNPPSVTGHITDWTVSPDGRTLESVRVAWQNNYVSEHFPIMRELRCLS